MAQSSTGMFAITVASVLFLLTVAVSQASGARILGGGNHPEDASITITESGLGNDVALVDGGSKVEPSLPSFGDCKSRDVLLLLGFLPRGTVVAPSGPSKRTNGINN